MSGFLVKECTDPDTLEKIIRLRYDILRKPWGQPYETARDGLENTSINAYVEDPHGNVIGCGRLQQNDAQTAQIRYMAVAAGEQGKGVGAAVLEHLEQRAAAMRIPCVQLQARENAVDFYRTRGYGVVEKTFMLWGKVQHYLMQKELY